MNLNDESERLGRVVQYAGRQKQFWNGYWYTWSDKAGDYTRGFREGNKVVVKTLTEDKRAAVEKIAANLDKETRQALSPQLNDLLSFSEKNEASSPEKREGDDAFDAIYGSSKVWSSPNALVFNIETDEGERITAIPYEFASENVVEQLYTNEGENEFTFVPDLNAFLKEGDLTEGDFNFLCKIGAIDKETHNFGDGRNQANIDEERHKYLRENDVLNADLPQFAPKKEEPPKKEEKPEPEPEPTKEPEPKEEPQTTDEEKPAFDVPQTGAEMKRALDSTTIDVKDKNRLFKAWAKNYFPESDDRNDRLEKELRDAFTSDEFTTSTKAYLFRVGQFGDTLSRDADKFSDTPAAKNSYDRRSLSKTLMFVRETVAMKWDRLLERHSSYGWEKGSPVFVLSLFGAKRKRYITRDDAVKNIRGLVSIPSVATPKEKQEVLNYIDYVKSVVGSSTTTDFEACMLLSDLYWVAKYTDKDASFCRLFKKTCKDRGYKEALEEIASRNPELAAKKPKWLSEDDSEQPRSNMEPKERRTLNLSIRAATDSKDFLSCAEQVRLGTMTEEEARADREYSDKLLNACNLLATGEAEDERRRNINANAEEQGKERQKQEGLKAKIVSFQSFKDYYNNEVYPQLVNAEIKHGNEFRRMLGFGDLDENEIATIKEDKKLEHYIVTHRDYFSRRYFPEFFAQAANESSPYFREGEADALKQTLEEITESEERLKKLQKERITNDPEQIVKYHEGYKYNHEATCAFLRKAFPDRGGAEFFSKEWIKGTLESITDYEKELGELSEQVFDVFNIIGRCYNVGGRPLDPPTVRIGAAGKGTLGYYDDKTNDLVVDFGKITRENLSIHDYREILAHELGHWLEHRVVRAQKNSAWLIKHTGTDQFHFKEKWEAQLKKTPSLTVRPDGYGLRVYGGVIRITSTELVSTGMEYLIRCATMFAKRSPEHFNLLIKNFEDNSL